MLTDVFTLTPLMVEPEILLPEESPTGRKTRCNSLEQKRERYLKLISSPKRVKGYAERLKNRPTGSLFGDFLEFLKAPLTERGLMSWQSELASVPLLVETGSEIDGPIDPPIPYEPWGAPWVVDKHGNNWSSEGVIHLLNQVFWESMEELALHNNEHEKWSVLKWIFMPAIKKYYVYDKRINRSHCLEVHERDEPFSFRHCCMAARMDPDELRDKIRQRLPVDIYEAVMKVVTF